VKTDTIRHRAGWWFIRPLDPKVKQRLMLSGGWVFDPAGLKCGVTQAFCTSTPRVVMRFLDICDKPARLAALAAR
jgi:hypothetical protein